MFPSLITYTASVEIATDPDVALASSVSNAERLIGSIPARTDAPGSASACIGTHAARVPSCAETSISFLPFF
jgi:hypothetical protein